MEENTGAGLLGLAFEQALSAYREGAATATDPQERRGESESLAGQILTSIALPSLLKTAGPLAGKVASAAKKAIGAKIDEWKQNLSDNGVPVDDIQNFLSGQLDKIPGGDKIQGLLGERSSEPTEEEENFDLFPDEMTDYVSPEEMVAARDEAGMQNLMEPEPGAEAATEYMVPEEPVQVAGSGDVNMDEDQLQGGEKMDEQQLEGGEKMESQELSGDSPEMSATEGASGAETGAEGEAADVGADVGADVAEDATATALEATGAALDVDPFTALFGVILGAVGGGLLAKGAHDIGAGASSLPVARPVFDYR